MGLAFSFLAGAITGASTQIPEGIAPVKDFNLDRYLGKWHENARLEQPFQKGMRSVTATYRLRDDGGVSVLNEGINSKGKVKKAEGKAYFVGDPDDKVAHLKVSFFGPFYGSYVVFGLDQENYQHAFVTGNDRSSLWLLSRDEKASPELKEKFIQAAEQNGFDTSQLIWDDQDQCLQKTQTTKFDGNLAPTG